jgi:uncharacterized membrane protein
MTMSRETDYFRVPFRRVSGVRQAAATDRGARAVESLALGLGCAAVLAQICYPLVEGATRDLVTVIVVLLLAASCVAHATATRGVRWAVGLVLVTAGVGLLAEFAGTATGLPFGDYAYTAHGTLGPEAATVPLLIGSAWIFGAYLAWCAATAVLGRGAGVLVVPVAAWGLASWDLYLDPQMVADGKWTWADPAPSLPGVPQVPLSNYAGWVLVALVICGLLYRMDRALGVPSRAHRPFTAALPPALFCWTWLGSAVAHAVFLGLPASAGYGLVGMGLIGVPLLATQVPGLQRQ